MTRCGRFRDIGRSQALRACSPLEIERAERQFRQFMHRGVQEYFLHEFCWPAEQELLGHATAIGYRSNKSLYGDRKWRDYIHRHHPLLWPEVKVARQRDATLWGQAPPPKALTILGFALDLQLEQFGQAKPHFLNWKRRCPALLCSDGSHRLLIVPQNKRAGSVVIVESPYLRVYPAGITN